MLRISVSTHAWPVAGSFRIAHGSVSEVRVVTVTATDGKICGYGECRPYARYNETPKSVIAQIKGLRVNIEAGANCMDVQKRLPRLLPSGAARNAVDCALWDLRCKQVRQPIWQMLDIPKPKPRCTAFTLSINSPAKMARAAKAAKQFPLLKLKIDGYEGLEACLAVLQARPDAELIVDANESLSPETLPAFRRALAHAPVLLIEQPLKTSEFDKIDNHPTALPILCADESLHTGKNLDALWRAGYRAVNVKLDKCGGVSEAVHVMRQAKSMGFLVMAGCMVGTSLAMAPMMALSAYADFIDLDGPLLLAKDVENGLRYEGAIVHPPLSALWG
ncbi:MAG: dipeptide epimerase [Rhodobacteraceae bacterium]|nr:dipeptide epimerase [Paracoccaceae bacterium]